MGSRPAASNTCRSRLAPFQGTLLLLVLILLIYKVITLPSTSSNHAKTDTQSMRGHPWSSSGMQTSESATQRDTSTAGSSSGDRQASVSSTHPTDQELLHGASNGRRRRSSQQAPDSTNTTGPPPIPFMQMPTACPSWIAEYAALHKKQRGQPGAKYLVYSACPGYSGLGDRIRAMMYVTRLAVSLQRVVLFTWRGEPHEPHRFLPPAGLIDWTLEGIHGYDYPNVSCTPGNNNPTDPTLLTGNTSSTTDSSSALRLMNFKECDGPARKFVKNGGLQQLRHHRFITLYTNEVADAPCTGCPPLAAPMPERRETGEQDGGDGDKATAAVDNSAACLFRHLFTLSDAVLEAAQQHLVKLYGPQAHQPDFAYAALHMRLGGMQNEAVLTTKRGSHKGPLMDLLRGLTCIQQRGKAMGIDTAKVPVLLFTDNHELRSFTVQGQLAHAVTPDITPTHLARMTETEASASDAAMSSYVDVALLARARCLIAGESGFSKIAWMLGGGHACYDYLGQGPERCSELAAT